MIPRKAAIALGAVVALMPGLFGARAIADGAVARGGLEVEGDESRGLAEPRYREAFAAWEEAGSVAERVGDLAAVHRALEARASLARLLGDPGSLERLRDLLPRQLRSRLDEPGIAVGGGPFACRRGPLAGGGDGVEEPSPEAMERLARFLAVAARRFQSLEGRDERDGRFVRELAGLVAKARGDTHQRVADERYRAALAVLESAAGRSEQDALATARRDAGRIRLLLKLREFSRASDLVSARIVDPARLPVPERILHLEVVRDLARFQGDRARLLATLATLETLGAKADESSRPGVRFQSFLVGSSVDLAETAGTLISMVAAWRLSHWESATVAHMAGVCALELGEPALAEEILRSHRAPPGDSWLDASIEARLGFARGELGRHEEALDALDRAGRLAALHEGAELFLARIDLNAARSLLALGSLDEARVRATRVLSMGGAPPDLSVRARILAGNAFYEESRESPPRLADAKAAFHRALRDLEEARASGLEVPDGAELEVTIAINLGNVLRAEASGLKGLEAAARRKEAIELQDRALRGAHAAKLYRLAAVASGNIGELYLESGNLNGARGFVDWATARAREENLIETEWRCHWYLARIAEAEGDETAAEASYRKAEEIVESYRSSILDAERKMGFLTDKMGLYRDLVRRHVARGRGDLALSAVERGKARTLTDSLGWRFLTLADSGQTDLYREFVGLVSRSQKTRLEPATSLIGVPTRPVDHAALRSRLAELRSRIEATVPRDHFLRALVGGAPLDAAEILAALPAGATLVEYFSLTDSLVALVATGRPAVTGAPAGSGPAGSGPAGGVGSAPTGASGDRGGTIEAILLPVTPRDLSRLVASFVLSGSADAALAEELYRKIFAPVAPRIVGRRVVVVPHGALHQLPFESLRVGPDYLVARYEFTYLPAATMLRYLRGRPAGASKDMTLLAVVDPDTDYDGDGKPDMPPLPFAREEVAGFAPMFARREILVGAEAAKGRTDDRAGHFDVIHYACHGEFYPERPWDSALFLAPPSLGAGSVVALAGSVDGTRKADGRLRASEVYGLDLRRSRLVALSGCETGRGRTLPGDDTMGIATAFLHAGARSLLVSLWKVEDRATSALMRAFYRKWVDEGKRGAEALRESKLELLAGGFPHPRQWAAFVLVGDP